MRNAKRLLSRYEDDDVGDIISESPITIENHYHTDPQQPPPASPAAVPPQSAPARNLWPWLVAGVALGTLGAVAVPLLIDAARQTAPAPAQPPVINVPPQQPPVINLPPAPEPVEPGRYFLRPGQPLDR